MSKQAQKVEPALDRGNLIAELENHFSAESIRRRRRNRYQKTLSWTLAVQMLAASRRACDIFTASLLLLLLSPILAATYLGSKTHGGGLHGIERVGRWGTTFRQYRFGAGDRAIRFAWVPTLWNVIRGEMAFIGPRPVSPLEIPASERGAWRRYDIRPGLICLWWLRKQANIAFSSEVDLDTEYAETNSLRGDVGIALRALPAFAYGQGASAAPDHFEVLGVTINNLTMSEAVQQIVELGQTEIAHQLCFVNADCLNIACTDLSYREILKGATLVLADGIGVRLAGRILNCHIRQNVNGTDLFPILCDALRTHHLRLFLLGGRPGVPDGVTEWIQKNYPELEVCGFHDGYFTPEQEPQILESIRQARADVLLTAFGVPRQEAWIARCKEQTGAKVLIGVGGLFDFYSGRIPRAPIWLRELGMEWFYRFLQEPRRMWRRYFLGNAVFLFRVLRTRRQQPEGNQR